MIKTATKIDISKELKEFRKSIDKIDDELISLLIKRNNVVKKVGNLKNKNGTENSIIRPGREATMVRRIIEKSKSHLEAPATAFIWRLIISSAINIEEDSCIASLSEPNDDDCYWISREHFGAFTPNRRFPTRMEIVREIVSKEASIGVLPLLDRNSIRGWWTNVIEVENPPHIFALLPFVRQAPSTKHPIVAIGHVTPEKTGNDTSLWVIKADETMPHHNIEQCLKNSGILYKELEHCRVMANPTLRYDLLSVDGFVGPRDKKIASFLQKINSDNDYPDPVSAFFLGAYANPIDVA